LNRAVKNIAIGFSCTATLLSIFFSVWALLEAQVKVGPIIGVILFQGIALFSVLVLVFYCMKKRHTQGAVELEVEEEDGN